MTKTHATELLAKFDALDKMLVKAGWPSTTAWWRKQIGRFLLSGRRRWVVRAGRRGGKSSTLCRLAYVLARWGKFKIPPADIGFVMFISRDRDEAGDRLRNIRKIAEVVGDDLEARGDELLIPGRRCGFKVYTGSVAGVSGPTAIAIIGDEVAKWKDSDTGANPADEVISSAMPCTATQPEAINVWSSSAFGVDDAHARMFDDGNTKHQVTSFAETWVANPTITEAETHAIEPKQRVWLREYASIPQESALGAFSPEDIDRAFARYAKLGLDHQDARIFGRPVMLLDQSQARRDTFAWGIGRTARAPDGRVYVEVPFVDGVPGGRGVRVEDCIAKAATAAKQWGVVDVYGDQCDPTGMKLGFRAHSLRFHETKWLEDNKASAVEKLDRWLREGEIAIVPHDTMKRELYRFEEKINKKTGQLTFSGRGSSHDDFVSLLLMLALVKLPVVGTCGGRNAPPSPERMAEITNLQIAKIQAKEREFAEFDPGPRGVSDALDPARHQAQFDAYVKRLGGGK